MFLLSNAGRKQDRGLENKLEYWNTVVTLGRCHTWGTYCLVFIQMLEWKLLKLKFFHPEHQVPNAQHFKSGCPSFPSCYIKVHRVSPPTSPPPPLLLPPEIQVSVFYSMEKQPPHNPPELAFLLLTTAFGRALAEFSVFSSSSPLTPLTHSLLTLKV